ncbi:hypothetical protein BST61_g47 [Cercospora zeina]
MRCSIFSSWLSIFAPVALGIHDSIVPNQDDLQTTSDFLFADQVNLLKPRAIIDQALTIKTIWMQTTIGTAATYVPVVFAQAIAPIPDQTPSLQSDAMNYNTLHNGIKRAAVQESPPTPTTPAAIDVVELQDATTAPTTTSSSSVRTSTQQAATSFAIALQTLIHTIGVQPVIEVTELTEITTQEEPPAANDADKDNNDNNPLSITATHNINSTTMSRRPTFPAEMNPERLRTLLASAGADSEGGGRD